MVTDKFYYCPICGSQTFSTTNICTHCKNYIKPKESLYDYEYYRDKALKKYGDKTETLRVLIDEEVSKNPLYNPNTDMHNAETEYEQRTASIFNKKEEANVPKCPTCGSTNIKKISTTSKVMGAAMFGLFSKTARSQFECQNCHYKW